MPAPVKKIRKFIEGALERFDELNLRLLQINVAGRTQTVWSSSANWTIDDVVPIIAEVAQETTNGNGNQTRFSLRAYSVHSDNESVPDSVCTFALAPADAGDDDGALSEPATDQGLLAMLMRHNNELHRQSSGTWGMMFQYLTGIVNNQAAQIEKLTHERMGNAAMMEELVSKKHERDMEAQDKAAQIARKQEAWQKILSLLPVAVNKITGKELMRQQDTLFEITATEFVNSLKPQQLDALLQTGVIDKHQLTLVATLLEQASKRMVTSEDKAAQSEAAQKAATNNLGSLGILGGLMSFGGPK